MDISIIIVNFNTFQITHDCLASVFRSQTSRSLEVILVDNASHDERPEAFVRSFPLIKLVANKDNLGFGAANNQGMRMASGKYVLLLNSDTLVASDTLEKCWQFMESGLAAHENIGLMGCQLLNTDGSIQPSVFPYLRDGLLTFLRTSNPFVSLLSRLTKTDKHLSFDFRKVQRVGDVSGAFMFLRASILPITGYFDTDFFMYCEDTEWCRRRIAKVCAIYYYPEAAITHFGGQSAPGGLMYVQSFLSQSLLWYKKGWPKYLGYILVLCINFLCELLVFPFVKPVNRTGIRKSIRAKIKAIPYLFRDIPKYPTAADSRGEKLVYRGAKKAMSV